MKLFEKYNKCIVFFYHRPIFYNDIKNYRKCYHKKNKMNRSIVVIVNTDEQVILESSLPIQILRP